MRKSLAVYSTHILMKYIPQYGIHVDYVLLLGRLGKIPRKGKSHVGSVDRYSFIDI